MKLFNSKIKSYISVLFTLVLITTTVISGTMTITAASFSGSGKGTVKSPYLVTNAKQLDEIRNNLSANYKLANNIDMSGVDNFIPIGGMDKPFTGTFSCDTAADGTAKYIIKNVTIKVNPKGATLAEKYSGYKKDKSMKWEAGLFGFASKAKFTNIVILNANVTSTVEGNATMNSDWSTNPGQSIEQSAGVLLGSGVDTSVTGCGASGNVTSASNNTGGLIGTMCATDGKTVTIKNCYSFVNVKATAQWNSGGLTSGQETYWEAYNGKVNIENCFYNGTFSGTATNAGAFCGNVYGTVKNCWATGTVLTSSSGCFYGVQNFGTINVNTDICQDCYTTAVIKGRTKSQTNKKLIKNNWITDAPGGLEKGFAAGSMAEINAAFANNSAWIVKDGTYPQLKDVHAITSPDSYNPISVSKTTSDTQSTNSDVSNAESTGISNDGDSNATQEPDIETNKGGVSTIIEKSPAKIGMAEKILLIVLAVIIILLIAATVFIIVKWYLMMKNARKSNLLSMTNYNTKGVVRDKEEL